MTSSVADPVAQSDAGARVDPKSSAKEPMDPMPWARAEKLLLHAGWDLMGLPNGAVLLRVADGPDCGLLADERPDDDALIDGHGMLSGAGGGALDHALARSVPDKTPVDEVMVGLNWTMVRAGPYCGIARSPERGTEGARTVRGDRPIAGQPLCDLAGWLCSLDPLRRSIGLAAINAYWNTHNGPVAKGEWGLARFDPPGEGLAIVGGFRAAMKRLPMAKIIEREPKGADIPADASAAVLASAKAIAITAQTLMNGSLEPLLARSRHIPQRLLVGPSAPVAQAVLNHGLTAVSGLAVTDPLEARAFIAETGTMIALDHMTKPLELSK